MSASTEDKDDSSTQNENQQNENPRPVKTFKNGERGPRNSQSSDYSERRKFNGDRNQGRGYRGNDRRRYGGRGGYNDRRRGNYNNRRHYNDWRNSRGRDHEPEFSDTNCYVANLPDEWDDKQLASIFTEFGEIESAAIMHANRDDRQRIAFVNFLDKESAKNTISSLHGKIYEGHPDQDRGLIVKRAYLKKPSHHNDRQHNRKRFDRNSSHGSMQNMQNSNGYQNNQSHPPNGPNVMNHNKNIHNIKQNANRRPPSGPPMHMQNQASGPPQANQPSFAPPEARNPPPNRNSDTEQLTQQMGSNWGPNSAPERHQRNPPQNRNYQGMQQQQQQQPQQAPRHSNQQPPQQQQQFMMQVVPQMPQVAQNYQYMVDQQGNHMQMQMMDQNGNMVPVMFPHQMQPQMQIVNVPGPDGGWVQQMVPVPQQHQVQHVVQGVHHVEAQQQPAQMMHGEMHQPNMMYEMPHDQQMNPYAMQHMQQQQQQMHHAQASGTQPPPGFQPGHLQHEAMRQMPPQHQQYVSEQNPHQFTSPRVNFGYPSSSQVYPSAVGLPMHAESQTDTSSNHHE